MFFSFGRNEGFPTSYPPNQTPVTVDVLELGFVTAFVILFACLVVYIPSDKRITSFSSFLRIFLSLLIGLCIFLGNFGQEWEVAHIFTKTPYRAGLPHEINASIGIKIGLRSVNVTLKSTPIESGISKEIIDYNERFSWEWDQGSFGFGPYAGKIQRQFREAQYKGLPFPILWIVDYFIIDGEGFRHGRLYRTAGWYSHIAIWAAFPCWLLANILFRSVVRYGGIFMGYTGGLLLTSNLLWLVIRNPLPLVIPFEDAVITTKFGISYWLTFGTGILCLVICCIILLMDAKYDTQLHIFFGMDPLNIYEEHYADQEDIQLRKPSNDMELVNMPSGSKVHNEKTENYIKLHYVKRNSILPQLKKRSCLPENIYENFRKEDDEIYHVLV